METTARGLEQTRTETFKQKTERNFRVKARYDELMREGKHGHYETMFRVVREEIERAQSNFLLQTTLRQTRETIPKAQ